jgi:hypothetical protein
MKRITLTKARAKIRGLQSVNGTGVRPATAPVLAAGHRAGNVVHVDRDREVEIDTFLDAPAAWRRSRRTRGAASPRATWPSDDELLKLLEGDRR